MGSLATRLSLISVTLFLVGPGLANLGVVRPLVGFGTFALGGLSALIATIIGLIALLRGQGGAVGLLIGTGITAVFLALASMGGGGPRINDITTDTAQPPQFVHATTLPANLGRDMTYPGDEFARQQREGYPDLAGLRLEIPPESALQKVEAAARRLPNTEVTRVDVAKHELEGVATSSLFRFQDDFIVEVRPDNGGSVVHMRSKSRDGKGDMGANAARIRALFTNLR